MRKAYKDNPNLGLSFLYNTYLGRIILKPLVKNKKISSAMGRFMDSKLSRILIKRFVLKNKINLSDYENKNYISFNDFFIRKIKKGKRKLNNDQDVFSSVCDSKLTVYKIDNKLTFKVKNSTYNISSVIKDSKLAREYKNGYVFIFRLSPNDYHRYYYNANGKLLKKYRIHGFFNSVNPVSYGKFKVFKENERECSILDTKEFDKIIYIEVGALLVGKIVNNDLDTFKRWDEKGYFMYGGSTVILIVKENILKVDKDILKNSLGGFETCVKLGEKIAKKL